MQTLNAPLSDKLALILRLSVGAIFGVAIAALIGDEESQRSLADTSIWRETLSVTLSLIAFVIWAGAGSMRRISLAIWTLITFVMVGYIIWFANTGMTVRGFDWGGQTFLIFPLLFIAHELVSSGDKAGQWIAPYETYFDEAWKRGVQLALALLFTGLFWGILALGAALLGFIGFDWFQKLLRNEYFSWPITGLAFGAAVHLGDVQTKLLANVRSLILGVLSWLLPVITLIGAIFAGSLLVSGLAPLWATKAATATLLGGCIGFVLLINAAYQQGDVERPVPVVLKWCVRGAALLLLIFAVLAAWSLGLRIGQYGLSADRIFAGLGVIIALAYGLGYSVAVFLPGRWMGKLEPLNIGLAIFKCFLFIAILTPIATPDRLSVNDQVARLNSGKVTVETFDWWLLKDETGRYGKTALAKLAASNNAAIAAKAKATLDDKIGEQPNRYGDDVSKQPVATRANIEAIPIVLPIGAKLPESFIQTNFTSETIGFMVPNCLRSVPGKSDPFVCKAALLDLNQDKLPEVLIREGQSLYVFTQIQGQWMGNTGVTDIGSAEIDFDAGKLKAVPNIWNDVLVGEKRGKIQGFQDPEILVTLPIRPAPPAPPPPAK